MMLMSAWVLVVSVAANAHYTPVKIETEIPYMFATKQACESMGEQVKRTGRNHSYSHKDAPGYTCEQQQFYVPVIQQETK